MCHVCASFVHCPTLDSNQEEYREGDPGLCDKNNTALSIFVNDFSYFTKKFHICYNDLACVCVNRIFPGILIQCKNKLIIFGF